MAIWQVEFSLKNGSNEPKTMLSEDSIIKLSSALPMGKAGIMILSYTASLKALASVFGMVPIGLRFLADLTFHP